ncbi:MAG: hypothetical protein KF743_14130 [Fimbriimonadaceae bacterium]|nr:hypothetical protein [Fimbriimonadaceae bacterium]
MLSDRYDSLVSLTPAPFVKTYARLSGQYVYEDLDKLRARSFELIAVLLLMLGCGIIAVVVVVATTTTSPPGAGDLWVGGAVGAVSISASIWLFYVAATCRGRKICLVVGESACKWIVYQKDRPCRRHITSLDKLTVSGSRVQLAIAARAGVFWDGWAILVSGGDWTFCIALSNSKEEVESNSTRLPPMLLQRFEWHDGLLKFPGLA